MSKQLTRKEKLQLIQGVKDGSISRNVFNPPKVYVFIERDDRPGVYEYEGKDYNETEYQDFCRKIEMRKNGSIIWNEARQYVGENVVIKVLKTQNKPYSEI